MRKGGGGRYLPAILLQPPRGAGLHLTRGWATKGAAVREAGGGRPRAVQAPGPAASPRVPGRVAQGGRAEEGGRRGLGRTRCPRLRPAEPRSLARSLRRPRLPAPRSDSRPARGRRGGRPPGRGRSARPAHLASLLLAPPPCRGGGSSRRPPGG